MELDFNFFIDETADGLASARDEVTSVLQGDPRGELAGEIVQAVVPQKRRLAETEYLSPEDTFESASTRDVRSVDVVGHSVYQSPPCTLLRLIHSPVSLLFNPPRQLLVPSSPLVLVQLAFLGLLRGPHTQCNRDTANSLKVSVADRIVQRPPQPVRISQAEKEKDDPSIKTPRPDISIGISEDTLVQKLSDTTISRDCTWVEAFLEDLQKKMVIRDAGKQEESFLCTEPTQRKLKIRFPYLVVEGKSYAAGKHIFEAQNQAAVSGTCALKIVEDLNDLVRRASFTSEQPSPETQPTSTPNPVIFSICTQGPIHELWAHYTVLEENIRRYHMVPVKSCRAPILDEVLLWLKMVDNVIQWGVGEFLESAVERLELLARRMARA